MVTEGMEFAPRRKGAKNAEDFGQDAREGEETVNFTKRETVVYY